MRAKADLVGLVLLAAVFFGFAQVPRLTFDAAEDPAPFGDGYSDERLAMAVIEYADNQLPDDALIDLDGCEVKQSNCHGVAFGGLVYYYCLAPHFCSCPLCRGAVDLKDVALAYTNGPGSFPVIVYSLGGPTTSATGTGTPVVP